MVKFFLGLLLGLLLTLGAGYVVWQTFLGQSLTPSPTAVSPVEVEKPLEKYSYLQLAKRKFGTTITFDAIQAQNEQFTTWRFFYELDGLKISGIANLPSGVSTQSAFLRPVIVLSRGFASQEEYYPGFGTQRVANFLAKGGYLTFAPDFLGYGQSDNPSSDVFEERFQNYTGLLNLLAGLEERCHRPCQIGLWGHSNGGQITLSTLIASGKPYPTVLWNPVTKPFPYSILYYTDSFDDQGKALRRVLAQFEQNYDVDNYSIRKHLHRITAPIFLQQGGADTLVPASWSTEFVAAMEDEATQSAISYKIYPGADHNLVPSWDKAVADLMDFYNRELGN